MPFFSFPGLQRPSVSPAAQTSKKPEVKPKTSDAKAANNVVPLKRVHPKKTPAEGEQKKERRACARWAEEKRGAFSWGLGAWGWMLVHRPGHAQEVHGAACGGNGWTGSATNERAAGGRVRMGGGPPRACPCPSRPLVGCQQHTARGRGSWGGNLPSVSAPHVFPQRASLSISPLSHQLTTPSAPASAAWPPRTWAAGTRPAWPATLRPPRRRVRRAAVRTKTPTDQ